MKWKNILNLTLKTSILICWMLYIIDFFTLIIRIPFKDLVVYVYEVVYDVVHSYNAMQCATSEDNNEGGTPWCKCQSNKKLLFWEIVERSRKECLRQGHNNGAQYTLIVSWMHQPSTSSFIISTEIISIHISCLIFVPVCVLVM